MIKEALRLIALDARQAILSRWFLAVFFTVVAAYDFVHAVAADTGWGKFYFGALMLIALIAAAQQLRDAVRNQQIKLMRETINYINERYI